MNWWLADVHVGTSWRLQELPDTELKHDLSDKPQFGRRYDVFHNKVQFGTLEVSPDLAEGVGMCESVQLEWVRLLPIYAVRAFLDGIALHVCGTDPTTREHAQARTAIEGCLIDVLWRNQQISEFDHDPDYGDLDLKLNGSAVWYFRRGQASLSNALLYPTFDPSDASGPRQANGGTLNVAHHRFAGGQSYKCLINYSVICWRGRRGASWHCALSQTRPHMVVLEQR